MSLLRSEWRRYRRVIPVPDRPLTVVVEEPAEIGAVDVRDLSEGGLELQTLVGNPAWLGASMRLRLALPGGPPMTLRGHVRHVEANRVGVVFEEVAAAERERIRLYVEGLAKETWWSRLRKMLQP